MTVSGLGMLGQLANESIAEYRQRFQAQLALIEAHEQRQAAAEAARLQAEAGAAAEKQRLQAAADADTQARRKEAQDLLQRHEATNFDRLKFWHFEPSEGHDDATPDEQHKEFLSELVTRLVYTCNHLQSELEKQHWEHEDATRALHTRVQDLEQAAPRPDAGEPNNAASTRQLEQQVDHILTMLGDISTFAALTSISEQLDTLKNEIQQLHQPPDNDGSTNASRQYKMSTFRIEKFDDYTHQDPVPWWQGFTTKLRIHEVPEYLFILTLVLNAKGGCQIWLSKISWEDLTREWKKRFIVYDASTLAINRLFTMTQGNTPTRDWLTEWQKIVATPDLELPFSHVRREFYNRSCAALSLALGDREQYTTFAEIIDKAREIIKTNRAAAHEKSLWQPAYVEKGKFGPCLQHVVAVQPDNIADQMDWVDRLPDIEFAYNTLLHLAIGVTPFELHHGGRKGHIFADLLLPRTADIDSACSPASISKYRELLAQARANMQKTRVRIHQQANRRRVPCPICTGDLVWVSAEEFALEQDVSRKLLPKWFGPWPVTSAAGDEPDGPSFVINIPPHLTVHPVFHASKLATYTPAKSDDFSG
ncbi:hypothetical protein CBR_g31065 [Chara braunii]|uniref:Tf2-1-like SH3-like domain-containing protein n=1 Tax=Chara braunii TaxID=69332 RepID=A0A388LE74_CHABU|nr:hypothetical protein CBR_g31065 [Chara braunii]|eukprot:GBG80605.1 hypothetical protein CBR_g31065 [Chara braunii]